MILKKEKYTDIKILKKIFLEHINFKKKPWKNSMVNFKFRAVAKRIYR